MREVYVTIGKGRYCIRTPLGDDALARMKDLLDQACGVPAKGMDQEDLLTLTCLKLAHTLDSVTEKLGALDRLLEGRQTQDDSAGPERDKSSGQKK